ncbi:MAG: hypothetical protein DRJ50_06820 [Actinobacteria bacterium]|nr:MAG: hypothetical protein DRJ50_06820 [Actinomycetota bacterium]
MHRRHSLGAVAIAREGSIGERTGDNDGQAGPANEAPVVAGAQTHLLAGNADLLGLPETGNESTDSFGSGIVESDWTDTVRGEG